MEDNKKIKVVNRSGNGTVGYTVPELGITRVFQDGEEKTLNYEEIRKLSYLPGGETIIKEYLIIDDKESLEDLNFQPEPEYFYTKEDIVRLMSTGTLDEFLDCLDFAPEGVIETIKELAVSMPLNDVAKRKAILDKTGFDVDNAVRIKEITEQEEKAVGAKETGRRAAVPSKDGKDQKNNPGNGGRRVVIKQEQ